MRKLLTILLVLIAGAAQAQTPITYTPMNNYQYKYWKSDSGVASIPYGDTSIGRGTSRPGGLVCYSGDNNLYYWNGLRFVRIGAGGSGGSGVYAGSCLIQVNDSTVAADTTCLATRYYVDSVVRISNPGRSDSYIIEGSIYHVDSLHFRSTVFKYVLDGVYIEAPITDLFLSPADLVLNRTDVFYLAADSTVKTRVGTLVAGILEPPLLAGQLRAAAYTVLAGATTPANVSHIDIYREGTGPEWSHTAVGMSPTWQYATNPYPGGLYSINSNAFTTNNYIYFQGTPVDAAAITYLTMDVRNSHPYTGALNVRLHNSSANTDFVSLGLSNGYDKNKAGEWMNVVIPAYKIPRLFTLGSVNLFWLNFNGNDNNIQFDNIRLQLGGANSGTPVVVVPPVPTTTSLSPNRKLYLRKDQYGNPMPGMTDSTLVTTVLVDTSMTKSTSGDTVQIGLKPTGVTAGSYNNANLIVGADGRILGVANGSGGTGGISKLGSPTYALIRTNDSTYRVDSTELVNFARLQNSLGFFVNSVTTPNDSTTRYGFGNGTFVDVITSATGNSGTLTDITVGNLLPYFNSNVATSTTTPAVTFTPVSQTAGTFPARRVADGAGAWQSTALNALDSIDNSRWHTDGYYATMFASSGSQSKWRLFGTYISPLSSYNRVGINTINPTAPLTVNVNGIGVSPSDTFNIHFTDSTAATVGNPQYPPAVRFRGSAIGTALGTSQFGDFYIRPQVIQGTSISVNVLFQRQLNGGGLFNMATFTNAGGLTIPSDMNAANYVTGGTVQAGSLTAQPTTTLTETPGLMATGGSNASSVVPNRYSSYIESRSQVWNLTTASNNTYSFGMTTRPTSALVPTATFYWWKRNNGGTFDDLMTLTSAGSLAIGSAVAAASAKLDVPSTTQGFLPPRMTTAQKNAIASPAEGLIVYDTDLHKLCVRAAAAWETITSL